MQSEYTVGAKNCATFSFYMSGENLGRLNVYIVDQDKKAFLIWRLAGNQGDEWKSARVPVNMSYAFRVSNIIKKAVFHSAWAWF